MQPRALLLDEPLSALDHRGRAELQDELKSVHRRFGLTVLHVTHSLDEAVAVAPRCVALVDGLVAQSGSVDDLLDRPARAAVARLTGARNVLPAVAEPDGDGCRVRLRTGSCSARHVRQVVGDGGRAGGSHHREGDRTPWARRGATSSTLASSGCGRVGGLAGRARRGGLVAFVPRAYAVDRALSVGAPVTLEIPVEAVHVIQERS